MDENYVKLGEMIRAARELKKMSLRAVASKTGISYSQLSKFERGESKPSRENILVITRALELKSDPYLEIVGYLPNDRINQLNGYAERIFAEIHSNDRPSRDLFQNLRKWFIINEKELTLEQSRLLAEELCDFYRVRKSRMLGNRDH